MKLFIIIFCLLITSQICKTIEHTLYKNDQPTIKDILKEDNHIYYSYDKIISQEIQIELDSSKYPNNPFSISCFVRSSSYYKEDDLSYKEEIKNIKVNNKNGYLFIKAYCDYSNTFESNRIYFNVTTNQNVDSAKVMIVECTEAHDTLSIILFFCFFGLCVLLCIITIIKTNACAKNEWNAPPKNNNTLIQDNALMMNEPNNYQGPSSL